MQTCQENMIEHVLNPGKLYKKVKLKEKEKEKERYFNDAETVDAFSKYRHNH